MIPVIITLIAGLATVIGALFAGEKHNDNARSFSLAFATGIMLMISLGELFGESSETIGIPLALLMIVCGALISLILDILLPHHHDHDNHEEHHLEEPGHYILECECSHKNSISRGMIVALLLHNLIEGLATGTTASSDIRLGISMALGIAIHNIPIGTTLAVSEISAGKKKSGAILTAALVGLSQPLGALMGLVLLKGLMNPSVMGVCNGLVSGILIFISFDELWPASRETGSRNMTIFALLAGICFIPLTECLFGL